MKFHDGIDFVVTPGQLIVSPFDGIVEKVDYPYAGALQYKGIQLLAPDQKLRCEIWYMEPKIELLKCRVSIGQPLGFAQDISKKYPPNEEGAMTPHIHVRISLPSFSYLAGTKYSQVEIHVDPLLFFNPSQL